MKEWRHKKVGARERAREVWKRDCQVQIAVAVCWSAARKIRGEIKRNMRGKGQ